MTTLKKALDSLTAELTGQECYKKYQETLKLIKKDEELYEKLNEYRKRNVELHVNKKTLKDEVDLEKEYHDLIHDGSIKEFLFWEQETLKMLRQIHRQVDEAMNLDYSFL